MGRGRPKKSVPPPPESSVKGTSPCTEMTTNTQASSSNQVIEESIVVTPVQNPVTTVPSKPKVDVDPNLKVGEERKLWVDVLTENHNPTKGRSMKYIAPKIVNLTVEVEIAVEDIVLEVNLWASSLILYVINFRASSLILYVIGVI